MTPGSLMEIEPLLLGSVCWNSSTVRTALESVGGNDAGRWGLEVKMHTICEGME